MKVSLLEPIEALKGELGRSRYYFRKYRGNQIVQRCPTKWTDTAARKAARDRFAATWGKRYKRMKD